MYTLLLHAVDKGLPNGIREHFPVLLFLLRYPAGTMQTAYMYNELCLCHSSCLANLKAHTVS